MRTAWCASRCAFTKPLPSPAKGLWLSWPKGQGKTLCAALEPIVEALHPAAPELELPDLAATPADALDTLGGWPLTDTERASLTEALRLPQTDAPRGLALLQPHGGGPAPAGERPVRAERPAGPAAAHFAQPAGKILYLPVWLFPAVCAGPAAPADGPSFLPTRAAP